MRAVRLVAICILCVTAACRASVAEPVQLIIGHGESGLLFAQRDAEDPVLNLVGKSFYWQGLDGTSGQAILNGVGENPDGLCSNPVAMRGTPDVGYLGTNRPVEKLTVTRVEYDEARFAPPISRELARLQALPVSYVHGMWLIADQRNKWAIVSAFSFGVETYVVGRPGDFGGLFLFELAAHEPTLIGTDLTIVGDSVDAMSGWEDEVIAAFRENGSSDVQFVVESIYEQGTADTRYRISQAGLVMIDEAGCGG